MEWLNAKEMEDVDMFKAGIFKPTQVVGHLSKICTVSILHDITIAMCISYN